MNCQTEKEDGRKGKGSRYMYQSKCSYEINQMNQKTKQANKHASNQTNQPASSNKCSRCNYHCKKEIFKNQYLEMLSSSISFSSFIKRTHFIPEKKRSKRKHIQIYSKQNCFFDFRKQ